jgi:MFS family permease
VKFLATINEERGIKVTKSALGVLFSVVFLDNLGFAIVLPYLYFYLESLGGSPFIYGVLLASYSLLSFIFTPIVARVSDRFGRRKILLGALAVSSASYFIFGAANAIWLLFAGRMLAGSTAATVPVAQAYVADVTTSKDRLKYLGLLGAAAGIAFILGPAIGGTLSEILGYAVPSFLASALAFANLVSAYFRLPEPPRFRDPNKTVISLNALMEVLRKRKIVLLMCSYFMFFLAFVFMQSTLSPWLQAVFGFGSFETGMVFFFVGGVSAFTQAVVLPRLGERMDKSTLTLISIGVFVAGLVVLSIVQNVSVLFAVAAVISIGFGIQYISLNTLISLHTSEDTQGGTLGIAWAIAALAQTVAPVLATTTLSLGNTYGFGGLAFVVSAAIAGASVPLLASLRKSQRG